MFKLSLHADAKKDLADLWVTNKTAAARITIVLQEIQGNQQLLGKLLDHEFGNEHVKPQQPFHVSKWQMFWRAGQNIWRLKIWGLERQGIAYRIIYAYIPGKMQYHVLAIAPRDWNYEENHELTKRIRKAYTDLI